MGLGSALVDPTLVAAGDLAAVTGRARRVTAQVAAARATHPVTAVPHPPANEADA